MSATTSAASACATVSFSQFPTTDVACMVGSTTGIPSNTSDVLKNCCKSAPVESFANNCGLWCLSVGQSVGDLQKCFQEGGVNPSLIFCNSNNTATATSKPSSTGAGASSSGSKSSGSAASATGGQKTGAAVAAVPTQGVSKAGLGMLAVLVVSAAFGALL